MGSQRPSRAQDTQEIDRQGPRFAIPEKPPIQSMVFDQNMLQETGTPARRCPKEKKSVPSHTTRNPTPSCVRRPPDSNDNAFQLLVSYMAQQQHLSSLITISGNFLHLCCLETIDQLVIAKYLTNTMSPCRYWCQDTQPLDHPAPVDSITDDQLKADIAEMNASLKKKLIEIERRKLKKATKLPEQQPPRCAASLPTDHIQH